MTEQSDIQKSIAAKTASVEYYMQLLNEHKPEMLEVLYAEDALVEDPYGTPGHKGMNAIKQFYSKAFDAKISAELTGPVRVAGDSAAFEFKVDFNGMIMEIIDVFQFNDEGKVISMKAYWSEANIKQP